MSLVMPVLQDRPDTLALGELALGWIGCDRRARLILHGASTVLWINDAAHAAFRIDPAISVQGRTLAFAAQPWGLAFARSIEAIGDDGITIAVPFVGATGHFLIRAWTIGERAGSVHGVEIGIDHAQAGIRYADFDRAFALTSAERETALGMIDGLAPREIAVARGVSIDTVRSHIRGIYAKFGVSTREQFFRRLAAFRIA